VAVLGVVFVAAAGLLQPPGSHEQQQNTINTVLQKMTPNIAI